MPFYYTLYCSRRLQLTLRALKGVIRCVHGYRGSCIRKALPPPGFSFTHIFPPCATMAICENIKPSPVSRHRPATPGTWTKRLNILSRNSSGTPGPVSATVMLTSFSVASTDKSTCPPVDVNFKALSSRFAKTRPSFSLSERYR